MQSWILLYLNKEMKIKTEERQGQRIGELKQKAQ